MQLSSVGNVFFRFLKAPLRCFKFKCNYSLICLLFIHAHQVIQSGCFALKSAQFSEGICSAQLSVDVMTVNVCIYVGLKTALEIYMKHRLTVTIKKKTLGGLLKVHRFLLFLHLVHAFLHHNLPNSYTFYSET